MRFKEKIGKLSLRLQGDHYELTHDNWGTLVLTNEEIDDLTKLFEKLVEEYRKSHGD